LREREKALQLQEQGYHTTSLYALSGAYAGRPSYPRLSTEALVIEVLILVESVAAVIEAIGKSL
jgi:hypothetical protein